MHDFSNLHRSLARGAGFGETVTCTAPNGDITVVERAVWMAQAATEAAGETGLADEQEERVRIETAYLASPEIGMTVLRAATGQTWRVAMEPRLLRGDAWELTLRRKTVVERRAGAGRA